MVPHIAPDASVATTAGLIASDVMALLGRLLFFL